MVELAAAGESPRGAECEFGMKAAAVGDGEHDTVSTSVVAIDGTSYHARSAPALHLKNGVQFK